LFKKVSLSKHLATLAGENEKRAIEVVPPGGLSSGPAGVGLHGGLGILGGPAPG